MLGEYYVYVHKRPDGSIFYVGKGKGERCHPSKKRNPHHKNIVNKYGLDNITVSKLYEDLSEEQAFVLEKKVIAELRASGVQLVNLTDGGDGASGVVVSAETRAKLSLANSGENHPMFGTKRPQEVLDKMSAALKGRIISEETKIKMSLSHKGEKSIFWGKPLSVETREKISNTLRYGYNAARGVPRTEDTKRKISEANSGEKNGMWGRTGSAHPNYGKKYSLELRQKLSEAHKGVSLSESHRASLSAYQRARWDAKTDLLTKVRTIEINRLIIELFLTRVTISPQMVDS